MDSKILHRKTTAPNTISKTHCLRSSASMPNFTQTVPLLLLTVSSIRNFDNSIS